MKLKPLNIFKESSLIKRSFGLLEIETKNSVRAFLGVYSFTIHFLWMRFGYK